MSFLDNLLDTMGTAPKIGAGHGGTSQPTPSPSHHLQPPQHHKRKTWGENTKGKGKGKGGSSGPDPYGFDKWEEERARKKRNSTTTVAATHAAMDARIRDMRKRAKAARRQTNNFTNTRARYVPVVRGETTQTSSTPSTKGLPIDPSTQPPSPGNILADADILLVLTVEDSVAACRVLQQHTVIAVDCEAAGMYRSGRLALVQVAVPALGENPPRVFLYDLVDAPDAGALFTAGGLGAILSDTRIIKLLHDCRLDTDCLYHQYNVTVCNVFDTQVAHAVLTDQRSDQVPLPIGLSSLLARYALGENNEFKDQARTDMHDNDDYWLTRPMTDVMIGYAAQDVLLLPRVHQQLLALLTPKNLQRAQQLSQVYNTMFRDLEDEYQHQQIDPETGERPIPSYGIKELDVRAQMGIKGLKRRRRPNKE